MGDFATKAKIAAAAVATSLAAESLTPSAEAQTVLRDNLSDPMNYNGLGTHGLPHMGDPGPFPSILDNAGGLSFVGNGQQLNTIEIIWQYGDTILGWNQGDLGAVDWMVAVYHDPGKFTIEGLLGHNPLHAPDYSMTFANPTNSDYATPIGSSGPANNHHAIMDISDLGWSTISGQEHLAFLIPVRNSVSDLQTGLAYSSDLGSSVGVGTDLFDKFNDGGLGPRPFGEAGFPYDSAAGRVTVIPAPATLALVGGALVFGMGSRRRED